ncbi:MAG: kinesin motor protein cin8 [Claussenomyces sp. TS43310]|nr:MAG: kinesin motor protein cin8 [Claussenomyces sp. TS43310]
MLKEFAREIKKLRSELIASRQKNGVYLPNKRYDEMIIQSDSRRILSEEQAAKIETMESNLRNKVQELFSLTSNFMTLKKDNESTKAVLDKTKSVLEQTEFVLTKARQSLAKESLLRKAHQHTEDELLSTLSKTVDDVDGLHAKNERKSDLDTFNRNNWASSQAQVSEVTTLIETRVDDFQVQQQNLVAAITVKMRSFVQDELNTLSSTQKFLEDKVAAFEDSETGVSYQTKPAKDEMDAVLEEIKILRENMKTRVKESLQGLSVVAERISAEVIGEISAFHTHLHGSYSSLGRDFKSLFEELIKHINAQKAEANELRQQLNAASEIALHSNAEVFMQLENVLRVEREQAAVDRQNLISQIADLVLKQGAAQDEKLKEKMSEVRTTIDSSQDSFEVARVQYSHGMDAWNKKETKLVEEVLRSRETLKSKLKDDWAAADKRNSSLQGTTSSVHNETVRIVDEQMKGLAFQMQALGSLITRARSQNDQRYDQHNKSLEGLSTAVKASYTNIGYHFNSTYERVKNLGDDISGKHISSQELLASVDDTVRQPLADLRVNISNTSLEDYQPTGETPPKVAYLYPTELPQTGDHEILLAALRGGTISGGSSATSPSKPRTIVFHDAYNNSGGETFSPMDQTSPTRIRTMMAVGLREIDANVNAGKSITLDGQTSIANNSTTASSLESLLQIPNYKRSMTTSGKLPMLKSGKKSAVTFAVEGRENVLPSAFGQSTERRRSPRLG